MAKKATGKFPGHIPTDSLPLNATQAEISAKLDDETLVETRSLDDLPMIVLVEIAKTVLAKLAQRCYAAMQDYPEEAEAMMRRSERFSELLADVFDEWSNSEIGKTSLIIEPILGSILNTLSLITASLMAADAFKYGGDMEGMVQAG